MAIPGLLRYPPSYHWVPPGWPNPSDRQKTQDSERSEAEAPATHAKNILFLSGANVYCKTHLLPKVDMNVPKFIVNDPLQKGNPKYLPSVLLETSTTGTKVLRWVWPSNMPTLGPSCKSRTPRYYIPHHRRIQMKINPHLLASHSHVFKIYSILWLLDASR